MTTLCLTANSEGEGGVAGGAGNLGQTSQRASGSYATSYGFPVIDITTGMTATFTIQLTDDTGGTAPSDLSDITDIRFRVRPSMISGPVYIDIPCTKVLDDQGEPTGAIQLTLTPTQVNNRPGVHYAQVLCYSGQDSQILSRDYRCYLQIRKGMVGADTSATYPVTIAQVRMAVMDTSAEANRLLDDLQFSDVMIAQCIQRAVAQWNETPPALSVNYTVQSFPYHNALISGAVAYLMQMVSYRYARNRMQHSNAGLSMDDSDKQQSYLTMAARASAQWKAFIMSKKTEHNMHECFSVMACPWFQDNMGEFF